jgi:hypothetical protein
VFSFKRLIPGMWSGVHELHTSDSKSRDIVGLSTRSRARWIPFMALLPLCAIMTAITSSAVPAGPLGSVARAYATAPQALVYGESYGPAGCSSSIPYSSFIPPVGSPSNPCGEVESLQSQGWDVTIADATTWDSMTESQFASYQLLVIPDPDCGFSDSVLADAVADESTWSAAVDGSVLIIGTDPIYHEGGNPSSGQTSPDPAKLVYQGLAYAGAQAGRTGLYLDLSCYYDNYSSTSTSSPRRNSSSV